MKAVQITQYGGAEVLTYTDVEDPAPGPGEAIVQLAASGINYMDVYGRTGLYGGGALPPPSLTITPPLSSVAAWT